MMLLLKSFQKNAKNSLDPRKGHLYPIPRNPKDPNHPAPDAIQRVATCQLSMDNVCYFYSTAPQIHEPGKSSSHGSHNHITILKDIIFLRNHKSSNKYCQVI